MKLHVTKLHITVGIIAAALTLAVFSACESTYVEKVVPKAELLSLRVGSMVMEGANIPAPVTNRNWEEENYNLSEADFKTLSFKLEADFEEVWFYPTVSEGAKVKWGVANRSLRPNPSAFRDTRVPAVFDPQDFIYFQVISEDGETINYYRFSTYLSSPVKELASIKIAGREYAGKTTGETADVIPAETWNGDTLSLGTIGIDITEAQSQNAVIDAEPWDPTATLRYAITPYDRRENRIEPVFGNNNVLSFEDGQLLYVEVTAENTVGVNIYCFRVYVGRIATIGKLTFINPAKGRYEALGKGTAKNIWSDNTGAGSFNSPHQPEGEAGFEFEVELDDAAGSWQYAKISSLPSNNSEPSWSSVQTSGATASAGKLGHGEFLAIKVTPPNRQGSNPNYFYKVKIGLLAAEFTVQPKSHVYKKGEGTDPLTFTLDRTIPNATYQWYEANSWYGGYGFDSVGRIGQKTITVAGVPVVTMQPEAGWGNEDSGILRANGTVDYFSTIGREIDDPKTPPLTNILTISDDGKEVLLDGEKIDELNEGDIFFDVRGWHVIEIDEKDNVSLHNGGNMYYRLPTPGKPIPGATGSTYTPIVDDSRRPFITNFSNESHYYWVEVTDKDTGLKATSARAVVVTEWGVVYKNGQVVPGDDGNPTTVNKEHYLIDLHAYETGGRGLQKAPRNPTPFIAGNHGDSYWIPIDFENGFDIMDYSVFTAQALFFLADGREWIQNWTQGDIGFGRDKRDIDVNGNEYIVPGEVEEIVLWYNLTNDNATRGLASSGNEPQGSGLSVIPEYIVVKPAGTKPLNQMPPFRDGVDQPLVTDSVGRIRPLNTNDAQGWFTPYIELCEVRFEGPVRAKPAE